MLDENYGVAVQFDEDEEEVCFIKLSSTLLCALLNKLWYLWYIWRLNETEMKCIWLLFNNDWYCNFFDQEKEVDEIKEESEDEEEEGMMETDFESTLKGTVSHLHCPSSTPQTIN